MKLQTKQIALDKVELKLVGGEGLAFSGYASKFGLVDAYGDTIQAGAYKNTLKNRERPIRLRWNHYGDVIGKWLKVVEDQKGLYVEGELTPGHSKAQDVYALLKHGAIDGLSIGYRVKAYEQTDEDTRLLKEIELVEISVVEEPADLGATVESVKSDIEQCESLKDFETILRDAGRFSKGDATALVSRIKSFVLRDSEQQTKKQAIKQMFDTFEIKTASNEKE
jgi:HK97 family phage prohead protease